MTTQLSIIVPTYNERDNISALIDRLHAVLREVDWEIVVVDDDSPDGTATLVREIARRDPRVRCIQRLQRRGLSSACVEGMLATASPFIAVMDADLQHDEGILPTMLQILRDEDVDIVIGSRYTEGGSTGALSGRRVRISRVATVLGQALLHINITDPMSGFFMVRRSYVEKTMRRLSGRGFKVLLDLIVSGRDQPRIAEVSYVMRNRQRGESKLTIYVALEFIAMLVHKMFGRLVSSRFVMFGMVGFLGVFVHLAILSVLFRVVGNEFIWAQIISTGITMTSNYILDNKFTYSDRKLRGWAFFKGLSSFYAACSFGALINVLLANFMYQNGIAWWLAGVGGAIIGSVWNYAITSVLTWKEGPARL